jgi:hypothetical protein
MIVILNEKDSCMKRIEDEQRTYEYATVKCAVSFLDVENRFWILCLLFYCIVITPHE